MYLLKLRYEYTHINENENAHNILKLNDSPIIHSETLSLLIMLPISRSTKLKCSKKRSILSSWINQISEFPNRKQRICHATKFIPYIV